MNMQMHMLSPSLKRCTHIYICDTPHRSAFQPSEAPEVLRLVCFIKGLASFLEESQPWLGPLLYAHGSSQLDAHVTATLAAIARGDYSSAAPAGAAAAASAPLEALSSGLGSAADSGSVGNAVEQQQNSSGKRVLIPGALRSCGGSTVMHEAARIYRDTWSRGQSRGFPVGLCDGHRPTSWPAAGRRPCRRASHMTSGMCMTANARARTCATALQIGAQWRATRLAAC